MSEYQSKTIKSAITEINSGRLVLPAIQRSYVWPEAKVYHLFDSIMRDYPIGTFLFWKIDKEMFNKYVFNKFIEKYDEQKGKFQRGDRSKADFSDYLAVLDGQQRLTSLYIGICGSYHVRMKGKKKNDPNSYYDKFLCIDILSYPKDEEDEYVFCFMEKNQQQKLVSDERSEKHFWVPVSLIYNNFNEKMDTADYVDSIEVNFPHAFEGSTENRKKSRLIINKLQDALLEKFNVNFYEANNSSLAEVVDIFVRVNSGGEKLNSSDLMLSVAAGEKEENDVHKLLQDAITEINNVASDPEKGFVIDKETLLTAGLMFTGAESLSLSKNENYSPERMNMIFNDNWESIIEALKNSVSYIEHIGFIGKSLSKNFILPIAYYFYHNNLGDNHKKTTSSRAKCDRIFIRQWLLRAMLNELFAEGTGATLIQIRRYIDHTTKKHFPLEDFMDSPIKKPLKIGNDQIDDIMDLKYGDTKIVPLLNELMKKSPDNNIQVDHIWPKSILNSKKSLKNIYPTISDENVSVYKNKCNNFANLQLLDGVLNGSKSDTPFDQWVATTYPTESDLAIYQKANLIPSNSSYAIVDLCSFWNDREKLLDEEIRKAFPETFDGIVARHNLQNNLK